MKRRKVNPLVRLINQNLKVGFRKAGLLEAALTHPSYRNENGCRLGEDFDRLEFFGDAILNYVICRRLFRDFPEANEGTLSRLRSILVSRKILMRIARTIRFQRFVKVSRGLRKDKNYLQAKVFVDALEALIAAYYFDRGLASAEKLILSLYDGYFDSRKLLRIDPNPKSSLQELAQKNWQVLPLYLHKNTPNGVECTVSVGTALKASAQCKTRREAEEKAAGLLTKKLRQDLVRRSKKSSSGRKLPKTSREPSRKS